MTNLNINCPNIRDIPYNQIPLQKVGDYWGFDTYSVTVQYTETIAVFKMSSEVIKCPTIGAVSFGQSPYITPHLPVRGGGGVVGHNIDRHISPTCNHGLEVESCGCLSKHHNTDSNHEHTLVCSHHADTWDAKTRQLKPPLPSSSRIIFYAIVLTPPPLISQDIVYYFIIMFNTHPIPSPSFFNFYYGIRNTFSSFSAHSRFYYILFILCSTDVTILHFSNSISNPCQFFYSPYM